MPCVWFLNVTGPPHVPLRGQGVPLAAVYQASRILVVGPNLGVRQLKHRGEDPAEPLPGRQALADVSKRRYHLVGPFPADPDEALAEQAFLGTLRRAGWVGWI